jgi:hypothetical protein
MRTMPAALPGSLAPPGSPAAPGNLAVPGNLAAPGSPAARLPVRLTRRGRIVVAIAAALLVTLLMLILSGAAQATSRSVPPRVAEKNLALVVVRPGQSLWSVAESADPGADTRLVVQQIIELNGLSGDVVLAGQRLWAPRG